MGWHVARIYPIPARYKQDFWQCRSLLQNCSSRREEALIFLKYEPRYLGCYGDLKRLHQSRAFPFCNTTLTGPSLSLARGGVNYP
jgi:hypothetical protein